MLEFLSHDVSTKIMVRSTSITAIKTSIKIKQYCKFIAILQIHKMISILLLHCIRNSEICLYYLGMNISNDHLDLLAIRVTRSYEFEATIPVQGFPVHCSVAHDFLDQADSFRSVCLIKEQDCVDTRVRDPVVPR